LKLRAGDFIIAAVIAVAALGIWIFSATDVRGEFAIVRVDGEIEATLDLRGGDGEFSFSGVDVHVSGGSVSAVKSTCPDAVCVKTGEISKPGQAIVCIPNRVSIEIKGEAEVDAIVGG